MGDFIKVFANQLKHPNLIYVRKKVGTGYKSVPLTKLKSVEAIDYICTWLESEHVPVRLREDA